jgi:hypothetical protein
MTMSRYSAAKIPVGWAKRSVPTNYDHDLRSMVGTAQGRLLPTLRFLMKIPPLDHPDTPEIEQMRTEAAARQFQRELR